MSNINSIFSEINDKKTSENGNIDLVCKISKPEKMFEINLNNIYLLSNIGLKNFDNEDEIGNQINNLQNILYKFNVNEVLIFRTFDNTKILLYIVLEDKLYIFNSKKTIFNAVIYIDNYVTLFYENNEMEIVNYKTFKYIKLIKNTVSITDHMSLLFLIIEKNMLKDDLNIKNNVKPLVLPGSKVINTDSKICNINLDDKCDHLVCERIWCIFSLNEKPCYNFSIIKNNIREFQYLITINNNKILFHDILKLINFLKQEFYNKIKACSFLI